jgi:hypothetical protein
MLVTLEDGRPLRGDLVLSVTQRLDLTPIPSTVEAVLRTDSRVTGQLRDGSILKVGPGLAKYRVVKPRRTMASLPQYGGEPVEVVELTAIPEAFMGLAIPAPRAVVKVGRSLGEIYRSCGMTGRVVADVSVHRFTCFVGDIPSEHLARVLQEEATVPVWRMDGALAFMRYGELFERPAALAVEEVATAAVESPWLQRHLLPAAYSLGPSGGPVFGRRAESRGAVFLPRVPARVLDNMGRCLVTRRTLQGALAAQIRAGDRVDVGGVPHAVVTAAHKSENGGGGAPDQVSKLWLATLED